MANLARRRLIGGVLAGVSGLALTGTVAAIDHTYETYAVTFPDGRMAPCATCAIDEDPTFFGRLHRSRALDVSFVVSSLLGRFGRLIDPSRIGMSGHSAGGASALGAMVADTRIVAGIDMAGHADHPALQPGLLRPAPTPSRTTPARRSFLPLSRSNPLSPLISRRRRPVDRASAGFAFRDRGGLARRGFRPFGAVPSGAGHGQRQVACRR